SFLQGCVQDVSVVSKKRKRRSRRPRAAHFSQKARKMLLCKERAKVKVKTLGEESPRPSLFFH
ncbi:MAG: hypothetical protein H7834_12305, partial [Magnetococcus sp. YQC-9]